MNFFLSGELIVLELFEKFLLLVDFYKCVLEVLGIKVWVEKCLKIDYWKLFDYWGVWLFDLVVEGKSWNKIVLEIFDNVCI